MTYKCALNSACPNSPNDRASTPNSSITTIHYGGSPSSVQNIQGENLLNFITATTPISCDEDYRLSHLWNSFEESSFYGVLVPHSSDLQPRSDLAFIPLLSALQIWTDSRVPVHYFADESYPPPIRRPLYPVVQDLAGSFPVLRKSLASELDSRSWFSVIWLPATGDYASEVSFLAIYSFYPLALLALIPYNADPHYWAISDSADAAETTAFFEDQREFVTRFVHENSPEHSKGKQYYSDLHRIFMHNSGAYVSSYPRPPMLQRTATVLSSEQDNASRAVCCNAN